MKTGLYTAKQKQVSGGRGHCNITLNVQNSLKSMYINLKTSSKRRRFYDLHLICLFTIQFLSGNPTRFNFKSSKSVILYLQYFLRHKSNSKHFFLLAHCNFMTSPSTLNNFPKFLDLHIPKLMVPIMELSCYFQSSYIWKPLDIF